VPYRPVTPTPDEPTGKDKGKAKGTKTEPVAEAVTLPVCATEVINALPSNATSESRTSEWYARRPAAVAACMDAGAGVLDIGAIVLRDETYDDELDAVIRGVIRGDVDDRTSTALQFAWGLLNAQLTSRADGASRNLLDRSCLAASQQAMATVCNTVLVGAQPTFDLSRNLDRIDTHCAAQSHFRQAAEALNVVTTRLQRFNNSIINDIDYAASGTSVTPDDPFDPSD